MKSCPNCGYTDTIKERQMLRLFKAHFPGLPVTDMINRAWVHLNVYSQYGERNEWHQDEIPQLLTTILNELKNFFGVQTNEELKAICGWDGELMDVD